MIRKLILMLTVVTLLASAAASQASAQLAWNVRYRTPHLSFNLGSGNYLGLHYIHRYPYYYRHFYGGPGYSIGLRPYSPVAYGYGYGGYYSPSFFYHGYAPYVTHHLVPPYYPTYPTIVPGYGYGGASYGAGQASQPSVQVTPQTQVIIQNNTGSGGGSRVIVRQGRSWDSGLWRVGSSSDGAGGQQVEILMDENGTVYRDSRSTQPGVPPVVPATPATPATPPATPVLPGESVAPPLPRQSVTDSEAGWLLLIRRGSDAERRQAARELTRFPSRDSVLALVDALKRDGSEQVRQQAAHTLGTMLAYETLEDLRQAARTDRDAGVRATALTSVQKIEAYYRLG